MVNYAAAGLGVVAHAGLGAIFHHQANMIQMAKKENIARQLMEHQNELMGSAKVALLGAAGLMALVGPVMSFLSKSLSVTDKARQAIKGPVQMIDPKKVMDVRLEDIIGQDMLKQKLNSLINRVEHWPYFKEFYANDRTGKVVQPVLLFGPPGTGKTHAARVVVATLMREKKLPILSIDFHCNQLGSNGPQAIADLKKKIQNAPTKTVFVFMDELDSLGKRTDSKMTEQGHRNLNEMLTFMEGLTGLGDKNVVLMGTTNHPEKVDPALLSRFIQKIPVPLPSGQDIHEMYVKYFADKGLQPPADLDMNAVIKASQGFSGRDLHGVVSILKEWLIDTIDPRGTVPGVTLPFTQEQLMLAIKNQKTLPTYSSVPHPGETILDSGLPPVYSPIPHSGEKTMDLAPPPSYASIDSPDRSSKNPFGSPPSSDFPADLSVT
jgi:AAA+ superfamily predicted ATPase